MVTVGKEESVSKTIGVCVLDMPEACIHALTKLTFCRNKFSSRDICGAFFKNVSTESKQSDQHVPGGAM